MLRPGASFAFENCMKTIVFSFLLLSCSVMADDSPHSKIATDLKQEAESGKHDKKTSRFLNNVAASFTGPKIGRTLGRGAAWISTFTMKPFMNASGFLTGLFEREEKHQEVLALSQFLINHHSEFDELYQEATTTSEMVELMLAKIQEIIDRKMELTMKDAQKNMTVDFINSHPEYEEIKSLLGPMTEEKLQDYLATGYLDKSVDLDTDKEALPRYYEVLTTLVGQLFAPKLALGIISKSLAGVYSTTVLAADAGTGISAYICSRESTQDKFENDKDLKLFCGYVTNKLSYELVKSRSQGYIAGKKSRVKIDRKIRH